MNLSGNKRRRTGLRPLVLFLCLAFAATVWSQDVSHYYTKYDLLSAPPAAWQDGLLGFANPANLGVLHAPEARFYWTTDGPQTWSFKNWALLLAGQNLGFAMQQKFFNGKKTTDYSVSFGAGSDAISMGFAYDWSDGDKAFFGRERQFKASAVVRPVNRLSVGFTSFWGLETKGQEAVLEVGVRPFGTPALTLFGDALFNSGKTVENQWSAGAAWRVTPGVHLVGRYFGDQAFTLGLALDLGAGSLGVQSHYNSQSNHAYNSYMLRSGGFKNNIFQRAARNVAYAPFNLKGVVDYQKYILFDKNTHRLYDLLRDIRAAGDDPRIAVIAVNMAGLGVRPEHAWELRQELKAAREKGKKVLIFFQQVGMTGYYLASVADVVVMEPQGMIMLPGIVLGRTYMKGTLEKLGLGFDEWRFFSHKTAYEVYSRESLSEADREQYGEYLDAWYNLLRDDISASRKFDAETWDEIINEKALFNGKHALEMGLVDKLDRWSNIEKIIKDETERRLFELSRGSLWDNAVLPEQWGRRPAIALVYGIGICDMDAGIRARYLERVFLKLRDNDDVRAVVFRVDSPGGSGMASDIVVDALKKCAEKKPVIVSQGQVAGSGGYWISIYGDKILAGPNTMTGSIGVIGGWVWDKGLSKKLGMTSDYMKRGEHADILSGVTLPLLGITVPSRNLTPDERSRVEQWIREHYDSFVAKVADGRNMSKEDVDKIARGRFYSGVRGKEIGLVDEIGGLMMALDMAKKDAGLKKGDEYQLWEIPNNRGLFDLFSGMSVLGKLENDPVVQYLKMISANPYAPLDLMPPGSYPAIEK